LEETECCRRVEFGKTVVSDDHVPFTGRECPMHLRCSLHLLPVKAIAVTSQFADQQLTIVVRVLDKQQPQFLRTPRDIIHGSSY